MYLTFNQSGQLEYNHDYTKDYICQTYEVWT